MNFAFWGINFAELVLILCCFSLGVLAMRFLHKNKILFEENKNLHKQVINLSKEFEELALKYQEMQEKLKKYENSTKVREDEHLKNLADWIVGLGVPGLVLWVAINVSGYAGGAAIVSALATLGGPAGMLGGIGVLIALGLGLKKFGFSKPLRLAIEGLVEKGFSIDGMQQQISRYPRWVIGDNLRKEIIKAIIENK